MATALAATAFVALFVVVAAAVVGALHRALRPREMNARSATALRELEPRGGRHRFHTRLFEVVALACASTSGLGLLLVAAGSTSADSTVLAVGGGAVLVAVWWGWRRGTLRAVEPSRDRPERANEEAAQLAAETVRRRGERL